MLHKLINAISLYWSSKKYPFSILTYVLISYIVGVFAAKYLNSLWNLDILVFAFLILSLLFVNLINFILKNNQLVMLGWLIVFLLAGVIAYTYSSQKYFCQGDLGDNRNISGVIINNPVRDYKNQEIIIDLKNPICRRNRVLAKFPLLPVLDYGDRIKFEAELEKPGMIEDFDYAKYLRPKKVSLLALNPKNIIVSDEKLNIAQLFLKNLYKFKNSFEMSINQVLIEPEASLAVGLITGSKSNLPNDLSNNLDISGLTHIIALSGFNVTIIIAALASVLAGVFSRKKIFWIGSILVIIFIVMTGASASVVRAGIFSLLLLYGKTLGRKAYQTNLLLLAAAIMLLFNSFLLADDLGFQLSFLAFAGIIYLSPLVGYIFAARRLSILPDWLKKALVETLSAQILVFPLIIFAFGRVSLISPLTNVAVLWILPLAMLLAFFVGISGLLSLYLGKIIGFAAWPVLAYIITVANLGAKIPLAALNTSKYQINIVLLLYLFITVTIVLTKPRVSIWQKKLQKSS